MRAEKVICAPVLVAGAGAVSRAANVEDVGYGRRTGETNDYGRSSAIGGSY